MKQFIRPAQPSEGRQVALVLTLVLGGIFVLIGMIYLIQTAAEPGLVGEWSRETPGPADPACAALYPNRLGFWDDGIYTGGDGLLAGGAYEIVGRDRLRLQSRDGYRMVTYNLLPEKKELVLQMERDKQSCFAGYTQSEVN